MNTRLLCVNCHYQFSQSSRAGCVRRQSPSITLHPFPRSDSKVMASGFIVTVVLFGFSYVGIQGRSISLDLPTSLLVVDSTPISSDPFSLISLDPGYCCSDESNYLPSVLVRNPLRPPASVLVISCTLMASDLVLHDPPRPLDPLDPIN